MQFLRNANVSERARQSAFNVAGDEVSSKVVSNKELAVGGVGGADACDLQCKLRLVGNIGVWEGRPHTKWPNCLAVKLNSSGGADAISDSPETETIDSE